MRPCADSAAASEADLLACEYDITSGNCDAVLFEMKVTGDVSVGVRQHRKVSAAIYPRFTPNADIQIEATKVSIQTDVSEPASSPMAVMTVSAVPMAKMAIARPA